MTDANPLPPSPIIYPEAKPYWDAAGEGRLMIMRCNDCGDAYFHPRPFCPFCLSINTFFFNDTATTEIYTFTHTERAPVFQVPAMVALDEGPIMMSAIVECAPQSVAIGQRVAVTFVPTADGVALPAFRPL